ncbi:efflux RND transporter periplasmic adaptor subunit [Parasulfuritortus cantonensis]|uniref:Efflux RND transporter periplasmic adaptor subunit n=1 Tax=Parasulfuritortus cantonensis TaxID=2528202 RepID=A0A4R1B5T5_9PROT|nr:efflux RND transporter periplasmic adaptor subunit [Parasulfuritortus cantonensis]TCJ12900.1 efflux RND transporter periplasmic adaptor subunit [Parasulfuritortus cantonensis]
MPSRPYAVLLAALVFAYGCQKAETPAPAAAKPALTVAAVAPERLDWPYTLTANGDVAAWQEAVISSEISNYRLTEVCVNVGDRVRKGQRLATIASATVAAELAQSRAAASEAEAALADAAGNAERARQLQAAGFYSRQMGSQYITGQATAEARLEAARAKVRADTVRLGQTRVLAPDDGIISARAATVGSLAQSGQELFRLIRGGRLEWRAEVAEADLGRIVPGTAASLALPGGGTVAGRVRAVSPSVDAKTRNGLVYVDLPAPGAARAGMFARGEFRLGRAPAMTLPQAAVVMREAYAYVYLLGPAGAGGLAKVAQAKVTLGRRLGDRVEIVAGLPDGARVVASGAGFLADGDLVRVTPAP